MTKSTQTLTQSGLLAVLLQRQRYRVIQLARRRAHRKRVHAAFGDIFTWGSARAHCAKPSRPAAPHLNLSPSQFAMSHQILTYTELRQQIHDRPSHPTSRMG